ncbi:MAG: hypothetical protein GX640_00665 [Fibrobacter sp.]|nr:hypothetical protein [Fibrobacter sp.]
MKSKLIEHISGVIFVTGILMTVMFFYNRSETQKKNHENSKVKDYINIPISNINDPFQRALLKDVVNIFYPDQSEKNASIIKELISIKEEQFNAKLQKSYLEERLSFNKFVKIAGMYLKFLLVYTIVMFLTWYGVQTLAVWRFVSKKSSSYSAGIETATTPARKFKKALYSLITGIAYFLLFCPAYVIAYSIRTEFNTDSTFFMVLLGVISNGLLVMYSNKFYAFLTAESRKGYIDTSIVKNLNSTYSTHTTGGIPLKSIFSFRKNFKGHIFDHIYRNARFQYLSTIKEQASFLITGLVIIEMALNIHGHLCYEMLQQILYKNFDIVIIIILGIFYTVKLTEILTDILVHRESMRYENR